MIQLPNDFIATIQPQLGDEWELFVEALSASPEVSVRVNDKITSVPSEVRVPWCTSGFYLNERPNFTLDPLFHGGTYYVQEAASMFVQHALETYVSREAVMLDLCAAPGGKSTLISAFLNESGLLVSNEYIRSRSNILAENLIKWGNPNVVVTNNASEHFEEFKGLFDAILVDAPCSGEGMFRKDVGAIAEWSMANVANCVARQRDILASAWEALKPGGVLIYSTCTYNQFENDEQVEWLLSEYEAESLALNPKAEWGVTSTKSGYQFYPHKTRGEGLFLAVIRKSAEGRVFKFKPVTSKNTPVAPKNIHEELLYKNKFKPFFYKSLWYALPNNNAELMMLMASKLNVLHLGIAMAEPKGKDLIPQAGLALSKYLDTAVVNVADVDLQTALSFLRCEAIQLEEAPRGFILITYLSTPLGWVKNVGNRCNNLYPTHWRIRMQIPEFF